MDKTKEAPVVDKVKYDPTSPEWQLQQNMIGCEQAAIAFQADAERYAKLAADKREQATRFRTALEKLTRPA